jgi:CheY-like chemotaxis protein
MKNKVLIIDDEPSNIFALAAVLRSKGWQIASATHADEGLKLLNNDKNIGVVLLDMMMPDTDGYETISLIRKEETIKSLPVIAVTAQAMVGDREKCLEAGANDYVSKPIDVDRLLTLLDDYTKQA